MSPFARILALCPFVLGLALAAPAEAKTEAKKKAAKPAELAPSKKASPIVKASTVAPADPAATPGIVSTNKAPVVANDPTFSASLQLRHYSAAVMEGSEREEITARQQGRVTFNASLFGGDLSAMLLLIAEKKAGVAGTATLKRPYANLSYAAYHNNFFSVDPYIDSALPHTDSAGNESQFDGSVGVGTELSMKKSTTAGMFKPKASSDFAVDWHSKTGDARVENPTGKSAQELGLEGEDEGDTIVVEEGDNDPTFHSRYMIGLEWTPKQWTALTAEFSSGMNQTYAPRYVVQPAATNIETSYPVETETYNVFKLKYSVSEKLSVANEFYQTFDGTYSARRDGSARGNQDGMQRYENILRMSYAL